MTENFVSLCLYGIRAPFRAWKPPLPYAIKNQRGAPSRNTMNLSTNESGEHWTLFRETRLDGVRIHPSWQSEALTETLSAATPTVGGFLRMLRLHDDGVVHSLDEQLLGLVILNVDDYL